MNGKMAVGALVVGAAVWLFVTNVLKVPTSKIGADLASLFTGRKKTPPIGSSGK